MTRRTIQITLVRLAAVLARLERGRLHGWRDFPARLYRRRAGAGQGQEGHERRAGPHRRSARPRQSRRSATRLVLHQPEVATPFPVPCGNRSSIRQVTAVYFDNSLRVERIALYGFRTAGLRLHRPHRPRPAARKRASSASSSGAGSSSTRSEPDRTRRGFQRLRGPPRVIRSRAAGSRLEGRPPAWSPMRRDCGSSHEMQTENPAAAPRGFVPDRLGDHELWARTASSSSAMMLVILIAGFTAGPAVSL